MSAIGTLGERKAAVLRAVVNDHIRTGEPVGSGMVTRRYRLGVSPATVRNDMAALVELGYLIQPHTSAGRIPTDRGYRFYVDALPSRLQLAQGHRQAITAFFGEAPPDPEEVVRRTALLLSRLTRYGAVAQPPSSEHVFIGGTANIVGEETFGRRETVRRLLETLEAEEEVLSLLRALAGEAEVVVRIGRENPLVAMQEASVVVASYRSRGRPVGSIAVIGPTRMHYPEAISAVHAVAGSLSRTIERLAG